jgi:hypothetical protein
MICRHRLARAGALARGVRSDSPVVAVHGGRADLGGVDGGTGRQPPGQPVPRLAAWSLGTGIVATVGTNLAHGMGHGPVGALVSAWPALALIGSFELLMLIRTRRGSRTGEAELEPRHQPAPSLAQDAPLELPVAPTLEQTIRARHEAGHSQRSIARELNLDRRKIKRILDQAA